MQHAHPELRRLRPQGAHESGLPVARRRLDDRDRALAGTGPGREAAEQLELTVPLDQPRTRRRHRHGPTVPAPA
jgi:hypothetical protein